MVLPPTGTILIGPCPKCHEMVAIFCGQALPLDTDTMKNGSNAEKEAHLMTILTEFIEGQVGEMIHRSFEAEEEESEDSLDAPAVHRDDAAESDWTQDQEASFDEPAISPDEVSYFRETELQLLDNPNYFRAIFG